MLLLSEYLVELTVLIVTLSGVGGVTYWQLRKKQPQKEKLSETPIVEELSWSAITAKTRERFLGRIRHILRGQSNIELEKALEAVEEVLYTSDLGPTLAEEILNDLRSQLSAESFNEERLMSGLKQKLGGVLMELGEHSLSAIGKTPYVVSLVGVNGAGKTTTIGKLAAYFANQGESVLVAAGDTFRAAAQSQLKAWSERAQVMIFDPPEVKDPSAVAYQAVDLAKRQNYSVVLVDTAGRLHTRHNLMEELKKMHRVMGKVSQGAPHETLLVLDANSGQNALVQAEKFQNAVPLTGVVVTKLDGSAKGGFIFSLYQTVKLPVVFLGVGEKMTDLRLFNKENFIDSLFVDSQRQNDASC